MSITQEEFGKRIHEIIQDKIFFSNISGNPFEGCPCEYEAETKMKNDNP